jgi:hypothetical protein
VERKKDDPHLLSTVTAETRFPNSAKAGGGVEEVVGIDPHRAGLDGHRALEGQAHVLRPHRRGQTVPT